MTLSITHMTKALLAPTMEAVIALSERTQTLECHPTGTIYTFYRSIDNTILIGYSEDLDLISNHVLSRNFGFIASRRGTRREDKLTRVTLTDNNIVGTYGEQYFHASQTTIELLYKLNWPLGGLSNIIRSNQSDCINNNQTIPLESSQSD